MQLVYDYHAMTVIKEEVKREQGNAYYRTLSYTVRVINTIRMHASSARTWHRDCHEIEVTEEGVPKTGLCTQFNRFQWRVLGFYLLDAPVCTCCTDRGDETRC